MVVVVGKREREGGIQTQLHKHTQPQNVNVNRIVIHVITRDIKNAWFRVKTNVPDNIMRVYCTHVCRVIGLLQAVMLRFSRARHPLAARAYVEMRLVVEAKL